MGRSTRWIARLALTALLVSLGGDTLPWVAASLPVPSPSQELPPPVQLAVEEAQADGEEYLDLDLMVPEDGDLDQVKAFVASVGGELLLEEKGYAQIKIPPAAAAELPKEVPATVVGTNDRVGTPPPSLLPTDGPITRSSVADLARINLDASGISAFRAQQKVDGSGVLIAMIDSGVDPAHPDLQTTADGRPKLVDWKDFTTEGRVTTPQKVSWGATYTAPDGRVFRLPELPTAGDSARFGYWDESKVQGLINRDLDRNGFQFDRFGVLLVASAPGGAYDRVYVDTNNDGDFRDEQPLALFREGRSVARLGRYRSGDAALQQLAFVVADLDPSGSMVQFGFDSLGHGTQVAGVAAAYSTDGLSGAAPGAQIMALKVINSNDQGTWFAIREAITYAISQGASVINLSLGGLAISSAYDTLASEWLTRMVQEHGVLILLASDNTGPGLSSGITLGSSSDLITVGAYFSPAMWMRDFGYVVPEETVWWRSGMGPRSDGAYVPTMVAPGGSPATSPRWLHQTGYTTAVGTSIAVPHVAGAAALLLEAATKTGLPTDPRSLKRALEAGARELQGLAVYEQGSGLLALPQSLTALRRIKPAASLVTQTPDGGQGLLARSYQPGSDTFLLSNPAGPLSRVNLFSSASWVRSALQSLTLPVGQTRSLQVTVDPPTTPGVHSAFLAVTAPDQSTPNLRLPVTYVRPVTLEGASGTYQTNDKLGVARYRRYFVEVAPGATHLAVSAMVRGGAGLPQGTIQLQVFRPDGYMVYRSDEVGYKGQGLSASFHTTEPVTGVWEIVVVSLPSREGTSLAASYDLQVEAPTAGTPRPSQFSVPADSALEFSLRVVNPGLTFTGSAVAYGLTQQELSRPWQVVRQLNRIDEFTLPDGVARLRLEADNLMPSSSRITLWLYRYDPSKGWQPYWQSSSARPGQQQMELQDLPAGRYQVFAFHDGPAPSGLQYQYRRLVAVDGLQLSTQDEPRRRERGQGWDLPLTIYAPGVPGRYYGQVVLIDQETGASVSWLPIQVSVGQPTLTVEPLVSRLQYNQTGSVVLEMRESGTGRLVDGVMLVDGRRYRSRNGQVQVEVRPVTNPYTIRVEVDLPAYQFYRRQISLPVQRTWLSHPTGPEAPTENQEWRRRAEWLLQ